MGHPKSQNKALIELLETYHELNLGWVERLDHPPSAAEFLRIVQRNRPVVISNAFNHWPAMKKWNPEYLRQKIQGNITVAETPLGNADSLVKNEEDGVEYFVKPHSTQQSFSEFLDYLENDFGDSEKPVKYAQSQDDNMHDEYQNLLPDVEEEISWASTLGKPDAINLWIGNGRSTSAMHKDNYENLYCMISGVKKFVLISPLEVACVRERTLPSATYKPSNCGGYNIVPDVPAVDVPFWPTLDPDDPEKRPSLYWKYCRPLRVELHPGEMLYLPAMWYHKVSQECPLGDLCIAVNYWYDMDFSGPFYSLCQYVRDSSLLLLDQPLS